MTEEKTKRLSGKAKFVIVAGILWIAVAAILVISFQKGIELLQPPRVAVDQAKVAHLEYQEISFPSRDGSEYLSGWHLPAADSDNTVIFTHSFGSNRLEKQVPAMALAEDYLAKGYNVLLFDFRNSGDSTGTSSSFGFVEQLDLLGAIDYILERDSEQTIVVHGFAMGASTAIMLGSDDTRISGIIADSPFAHLTDYMMDNMSSWTNVPTYPFSWFIIGTMPLFTGLDPEGISPKSMMADYDTPILLIHGEADQIIPPQSSLDIAEEDISGITKTTLIPEAGHLQGYYQDRDAYLEAVLPFLAEVFEE